MPPEPVRAPQTTRYQARFPALAVALASGALVTACEAPQCGDSRADELSRHGAQGLRSAGDGRVAEGLRELGVALGVVSHASTRDYGRTAGAVAPVNVVPPPQNVTSGARAPVTPEPHVLPSNGVPQPTTPPATPTTPTTLPTVSPQGGGAVSTVTHVPPQPTPPQSPVRPPHPIRTAGVPRRTTPDPTRPTLDL